MYINKTQILGNITRDPELKALPSGNKVCTFSVATNEVLIKDGKKQEKVEYHNIICFGKTAENIAQYMKKGSQIYIEGKNQTRSWDGADGKKMYRTEVLAERVQFGSHAPATPGNSAKVDDGQQVDEPSIDYSQGEDEDIPF